MGNKGTNKGEDFDNFFDRATSGIAAIKTTPTNEDEIKEQTNLTEHKIEEGDAKEVKNVEQKEITKPALKNKVVTIKFTEADKKELDHYCTDNNTTLQALGEKMFLSLLNKE